VGEVGASFDREGAILCHGSSVFLDFTEWGREWFFKGAALSV
jgi:hypothetical protein